MSSSKTKRTERRASSTDWSSRPSSSSSGSTTARSSSVSTPLCTCAYHLLSYINFKFCEPHSPEFFRQLAASGIKDKATMEMLDEAWAEEEVYERSNLIAVCSGDRLSTRVGYLLACSFEGTGEDERLGDIAEV